MIIALALLSLSIAQAAASDGYEILLPTGKVGPRKRYRKTAESNQVSPCRKLLSTANPRALSTLFQLPEVAAVFKKARSDRSVRDVLADLLIERGSSYGEFLKLLTDAQTTQDQAHAFELKLHAKSLLLRDQAVWLSDWDSPEIVTFRFDDSGMPLGMKLAGAEGLLTADRLKILQEIYETWGMTNLTIHLEPWDGFVEQSVTREFFEQMGRMMQSTPIHHFEITHDAPQQYLTTFRSTIQLFRTIANSAFARRNLRSLIWHVRPPTDFREYELHELAEVPEFFERLDHLESLELGQAVVGSELLAAVARAKAPLKHLGLLDGNWGNGLVSLHDFPKLNSLRLVDTQLGDSRYEQIQEIAPRLVALDLRLYRDSPSFRQTLLKQARALEQVRWGRGHADTLQAEINALASLPNLRELDLFGLELGYPAMRALSFKPFGDHRTLESVTLHGAVDRRQILPFLKIPTLHSVDVALYEYVKGVRFPANIKHIYNQSGNLGLRAPGLISMQINHWLGEKEIDSLRTAYPGLIVGSGVTTPFDLPLRID